MLNSIQWYCLASIRIHRVDYNLEIRNKYVLPKQLSNILFLNWNNPVCFSWFAHFAKNKKQIKHHQNKASTIQPSTVNPQPSTNHNQSTINQLTTKTPYNNKNKNYEKKSHGWTPSWHFLFLVTLWQTNIAMEYPLIGNTSSIRVHFPASYVRLLECINKRLLGVWFVDGPIHLHQLLEKMMDVVFGWNIVWDALGGLSAPTN